MSKLRKEEKIMEEVMFEVDQKGEIISRSLRKVGFPTKDWFPETGKPYWVDVIKEEKRSYLFSPVTDEIILISHPSRPLFSPQLRLEDEEFWVYVFQRKIEKGLVISEKYVPYSKIPQEDISARQTDDKFVIYFSAYVRIKVGGSKNGYREYVEVTSEGYPPPFSTLPKKYHSMAEKSWKGKILSDGIWVRDPAKIPTTGDEIRVGGRSIKFERDNETIAVVKRNLVERKVRLLSFIEGHRIYEGEIWEIYYETPFGTFFSSSIRKIQTSGWEERVHSIKIYNSSKDVFEETHWATEGGIKDLIEKFDKRIPCEFCYSPKGEEKTFRSTWRTLSYAADHGPDIETYHDKVVKTKICPLCEKKGREGKLYVCGSPALDHMDIKLFDI